jgi:hypothetical protein
MRRFKSTLSMLSLIFFLAACGTDLDVADRQVRGSGNVVEESRDVGDYDEIQLAGEGRVVFGAASDGVVEIETDDNLLQLIEVEVDGDRLIIGTRGAADIEPSSGIEYRLGCPALKGARILGAGSIETADCVTSGDLGVAILGAGTIEVDAVEVEGLIVNIAGAGDVVATGTADEVGVEIPGAGRFDGSDLASGVVEVEISGDGSATVWATESLDVAVLGRGDVAYYGSPTVTQSVVGVGSVESLGAK